ncbi:MAG: hypothetical protein QW478_09750 [Candidatus Micrarchaeaceae archaeon]
MTVNINQENWWTGSTNMASPNVVFCDYTVSTTVSTTNPMNLGLIINVSNPSSQTLWLEVSGTVTLASGSTAIVDFPTVQLGSFASSSTENVMLNNIIVSSYPTTTNPFEIETINATFSYYLDSGYTQLYQSASTTFSVDFINPLSTSWTGSAVIYSGTNSGWETFSTSNVLSYSSTIFIGSGYSLLVDTTNFPVTSDYGSAAQATTVATIPQGAYFLAEYFIYPTTVTTQINVSSGFVMNPLNFWNFYFASPSLSSNLLAGLVNPISSNSWQVIYDIGYNNSSNSINFEVSAPLIPSIPYYYGYCRVMWSTTNIIY